MRISINITNYSWPGGMPTTSARLAEVARSADETGLDAIWVGDHLLQRDPVVAPGENDILEAFTTLGFLAAHTHRVELGAMVAAVTYRSPALLIKAVTTLDVLSGGRAWFGIGAGYDADEARAMGLSMPPTMERFERLEQTLRLALQMWAGDETPFRAEHYHLDHPQNRPNSIRRPHPPILIGGHGERRPCHWSPDTQTPAICSTSPTTGSQSATSWTCSVNSVRQSAGRTSRSRRP